MEAKRNEKGGVYTRKRGCKSGKLTEVIAGKASGKCTILQNENEGSANAKRRSKWTATQRGTRIMRCVEMQLHSK